MNKAWITISQESADAYRSGYTFSDDEYEETVRIIRTLDVMGLFETCWLVFKHTNSQFGYPNK